MNDTINPRATKILRVLAAGHLLSRAEIQRVTGESRINTIRELGRLLSLGNVVAVGESRATRYAITMQARTLTLWDVENYLAQEPDRRPALYISINPALFDTIAGVFRPSDFELMHQIHQQYAARRVTSTATTQRELERFVIELSWKSSKIEGNTYTLLDTEQLLRDHAEAAGHSHDEAIMILGHKRAFEYIWTHRETFTRLSRSHLEEVHQLLTDGLNVPRGLRSGRVGITGTVYVPPASIVEVASHLDVILKTINEMSEPAGKALACLVLLPYLQPFIDGNKRTSRLIANAVLLAHGYPPLSYRSVNEQLYKGALILFYEQGALANFRDLFVEQLEFSASNYFL